MSSSLNKDVRTARDTEPRLISKLITRLGIDQAIAFSMANRFWASLAGIAVLVAVGRWLTPAEQGYYYTFGSVLALQVFVELGLTFVIMQFASHERARLVIQSSGVIDGDSEAKARLASLLRMGLRWYLVAALLFTAIILPVGFVVFSRRPVANVNWHGPWVLVVLAWAVSLFLSPVSAILEGCGLVASVAKFRFLQSIIATAVLWAALAASAKLFAPFLFATANLVALVGWLALFYRGFLLDLLRSDEAQIPIHWRSEIWPFQWRIALSWLSGYFIAQIFTPILFIFRGPVEAGQMGMSLTLMGVVSATSLTWVSTKAPRFGVLAAQRRLGDLDSLFLSALKRVCATGLLGAFALILLLGGLNYLRLPLVNRLLPLPPFLLLVGATLLAVIVSAEASYLRAFKREPFVRLAVINGLLITALSLLVVRPYGVSGMMTIYFIANLTIGLGLGTAIFRRERARHYLSHHADADHRNSDI